MGGKQIGVLKSFLGTNGEQYIINAIMEYNKLNKNEEENIIVQDLIFLSLTYKGSLSNSVLTKNLDIEIW